MSTAGDVFYIKRRCAENELQGYVSFGVSEAFGGISQNKIWWVLYGRCLSNITHTKRNTRARMKHTTRRARWGSRRGDLKQGPISMGPNRRTLYITYADRLQKSRRRKKPAWGKKQRAYAQNLNGHTIPLGIHTEVEMVETRRNTHMGPRNLLRSPTIMGPRS